MLKLLVCVINALKNCGFRLLCIFDSCNYEERKALIYLLHDGEIDEARYIELSEECSSGKLTYEQIGVDGEKLHKAIRALHNKFANRSENHIDSIRKTGLPD